MNRYPIFVYGTLKRGYGLGDSLQERDEEAYFFLDEAITQEQFGLLDGGYPHLVPAVDAVEQGGAIGNVLGELRMASYEAMQYIMRVEGGAGYIPYAVNVIRNDAKFPNPVSALTWVLPRPGGDRWIMDGDPLVWDR